MADETTEQEQVVTAKVDTSNAEKNTKSLKTQIREVREELQTLKRGTDEYNQALERYGALMKENTRVMKDMKASATDAIGTFSNMAGAVKGVTGGFQTFLGTMGLAKGDTQELTETFMKLQSAMAITQGLKAMQSGIKNLNVVWSSFNKTLLANPFTAIATVLLALIAYFADWDEVLENISKPLKELWEKISDLLPAFEGATDGGRIFTAAISALATFIGEFIKRYLSFFIDNFKEFFDTFKNGGSIIDLIVKKFTSLANTVKRLVSGPFQALTLFLKGDTQGAMDALAGTLDVLREEFPIIDETINSFNESLNKEAEQAKETSKAIKNLIDEKTAMYGSDWKYSTEGQAMWKKYYEVLLSEQQKDTDEYRKAWNEKLAFERDSWQHFYKIQEEERKRQEAAQKQFNAILDQMDKEANAERLKTLRNEEGEEWYLKYLADYEKKLKDSAKVQKDIMDDESKSWVERAVAAQEYKKTMDELSKTEKEITEIEAKMNDDRIKAQNRLTELEQKSGFLQMLQRETELQKEDTEAYKLALQDRMAVAQEQIEQFQRQLDSLDTSDENYLNERAKLLDERNAAMEQFTDAQMQYVQEASAKERMAYYQDLADQNELEVENLQIQLDRLAEVQNAYAVETFEIEQEMQTARELGMDDEVKKYEMILQERYNADAEMTEEYNSTLEKQNTARKKQTENEKKYEKSYEELQKDRQKATEATLSVASDCFGTMADMFGEQTVAGKVAAVAQATIDTYSSAVKSFNAMADIPFVGPALGAVAAAEAVASGVMNIKEILAVDTGSDKDTTSASSVNASLPDMPEVDDITESYTTVTGFDEDVINDLSQPVLVVEDVNDAQNRVSTAESNSTF